MMPRKDPFGQILCDLASSIELSKQLETELARIRRLAARREGNDLDFISPLQSEWADVGPARLTL